MEQGGITRYYKYYHIWNQMPFLLHCWKVSVCYRNFWWKQGELQLTSALNSPNRKTTKYWVKKIYPRCECRSWLCWLKLAKVYLLSSLLHSLKAADHFNEFYSAVYYIHSGPLATWMKFYPAVYDNNSSVLENWFYSAAYYIHSSPLATCMRFNNTRDSMCRYVMFSWFSRTWLIFSPKRTVRIDLLSVTGADYQQLCFQYCESCNTKNSNWSKFGFKWQAIPISDFAFLLLNIYFLYII